MKVSRERNVSSGVFGNASFCGSPSGATFQSASWEKESLVRSPFPSPQNLFEELPVYSVIAMVMSPPHVIH